MQGDLFTFVCNESSSSLTGELETEDKYMDHLHFNPKQGCGGRSKSSFRKDNMNSDSAKKLDKHGR